jgi:hypothetical protein
MAGSPFALQNFAEHKQNPAHHRPIHNPHLSSFPLDSNACASIATGKENDR